MKAILKKACLPVVFLSLAVTATNATANVANTKLGKKEVVKYEIFNPQSDVYVVSLDNQHARALFRNVENEKNFINKQVALGFLRADNIDPTSEESKAMMEFVDYDQMFKFFVVHKDKQIVDVADVTLSLKKPTKIPKVTYKTINNNKGEICVNEKDGEWFNNVGILNNKENSKESCIYYSLDSFNDGSNSGWQ